MPSNFFKNQCVILNDLKYKVLGGMGFVIATLSVYYGLIHIHQSNLEEYKAKNIASSCGVIGYTLLSFLAAKLQKKPYYEATAKSTEVTAFVGFSIGSQALFSYWKWSMVAGMIGSQLIGVAAYAGVAFVCNKIIKDWESKRHPTKEAAKQTSDQLVEMCAFAAGTTLMNILQVPVYATYLFGLLMFSLAAWIKGTLLYHPENDRPYIHI